MKGAKNLLCPECGRFFSSFRQENRLGKYIKALDCECGTELIVSTDNMAYWVLVKKNGVVIKEEHGAHTTKSGRSVWRRNIPHYIAPKKSPYKIEVI